MIKTPTDYPGAPDETTRRELSELFKELFPNTDNPRIDDDHAGIAITAHSPKLALNLASLTRFIALDLPWCERKDLRDLAIQVVNTHFNCHYGFKTRITSAEANGISIEQQKAISSWKTSELFNEEKRQIIQYAYAVIAGDVSDDLFSGIVTRFGERGAVELTSVIGLWSFWAMMLNATYPAT